MARKKDFDNDFCHSIAKYLHIYLTDKGKLDKASISQVYSNTKDTAYKDGDITYWQYFSWCSPVKAYNLNYLKRLKSKL